MSSPATTICRTPRIGRDVTIMPNMPSTTAAGATRAISDNAHRHRRLQNRRLAAKTGMTVAMGVLVWSAMAGRRVLRRYHPLAGVALLGFTVWHMGLYKPKSREVAAK